MENQSHLNEAGLKMLRQEYSKAGFTQSPPSEQLLLPTDQYVVQPVKVTDTPAMKTLKVITYVVVIATCIMVIWGVLDVLSFLHQLRQAAAELGRSFRNVGLN